MATQKQIDSKDDSRAKQRYRYIRYLAEMQDLNVRDLHRAFCRSARRKGESGCDYSVFYRICQGKRRSERIMKWVSRKLRVPYEELWV